MVHVDIHREQKIVEAQITGFVKVDEVVRASNEIKASMKIFGPQEAVLLVDLIGFTPMSNDVLPVLRGLGRDVISFFRKSALIQDFAMTFQGNRKVIEPPPGYKLPSFPTRDDALAYLTAREGE